MMLQGASDWLYVYPRGLWDLLLHIKRNYNNPLIYITENGTSKHDFFSRGVRHKDLPWTEENSNPTSFNIDE